MKVNKKKTSLLAVGFFAVAMVIYLMLVTVPDIGEYFSAAHFERGGELGERLYGEIRDVFWKVLIGLVLQICFFSSIAFWSFYEAMELTESPRKWKKVTESKHAKTEEVTELNARAEVIVIFIESTLVCLVAFLSTYIVFHFGLHLSVVLSVLVATVFGIVLGIMRR